jgi:hypothetical protein
MRLEPPQELPTSALLIRIVEACTRDEISVGDLIDGLGDRAFAIILLMLSLPIAIPGPPGLPAIFGAPMLIFTAQLCLGYHRPWLPGFVRRRRFSRSALLSLLRRVRPVLTRLEQVCRPRLLALTAGLGERLVGGFFFLSAAVLMNPVPIPFSHLPLGIALAILALGYVERDGIVVIAGLVGGIVGIVVNVSLTGSLFFLGMRFLHHFLQ